MQEKQEPIPSIYSQDLRDLAQKLLIKDFRARPDIKEITGTPFIKKVAEGFIARRGKLEDAIPIKTTELHKDMMDNDNEDQHYTQSTSTATVGLINFKVLLKLNILLYCVQENKYIYNFN